jgi:glucan biosynthesis protein C
MTTRAFHRFHALDALRASMMLLGLVLHSAVSYVVAPMHEAWPYKDAATSTIFDLLVFFVHLFRMPVFFVVAGFFAGMLMQRDGARGFIRNRALRVLVPLALFWPIIYTAVAAGFVYANGRAAGQVDMSLITSGAYLGTATLGHLWFLWHLMIFYVAAALLAPLAARIPAHAIARVESAFAALATSIAGALAMSAITAVTLLPMTAPALDTPLAFAPPLRVLIAYAVFFSFGWLMYRRRDIIEPFGAKWKLPMAVGVAAALGYLVVTVGKVIADPTLHHVIGCALAGLSMWMLIFGIVGLFVSILTHPRPIVRYLSDASYWMYIVHLPFTIAIPGLLATWPAPAVVKFAITLAVTSLVTVVSYHYLVRATAIGALLNGRRYPRSLPSVEPARPSEVAAV